MAIASILYLSQPTFGHIRRDSQAIRDKDAQLFEHLQRGNWTGGRLLHFTVVGQILRSGTAL